MARDAAVRRRLGLSFAGRSTVIVVGCRVSMMARGRIVCVMSGDLPHLREVAGC